MTSIRETYEKTCDIIKINLILIISKECTSSSLAHRPVSCHLGILQSVISSYISEKVALPNPINTDLKKGFTVTQTAEKHGWPESMVWVLKLDGKNDLDKCLELQWGIKIG